MNFYLIIPVSSVEIDGLLATIYHIYQNPSKTGYNVYQPSYSSKRYLWPRKKLTRKVLDKCFYLPMYYKSIKASDINKLVKELNMHSKVYKIVI